MAAVVGQVRVKIDNEVKTVHPETEVGAIKDFNDTVADKLSDNTSIHTAEYFTQTNPVLEKGQFGYESDTQLLKVGDGVSSYNNLNYVNSPVTGIEVKIRANSSSEYAPVG